MQHRVSHKMYHFLKVNKSLKSLQKAVKSPPMIKFLKIFKTKVLRSGWNYLMEVQNQILILFKKFNSSQSHPSEFIPMPKKAWWTIFFRRLVWMLSNTMQACVKNAKCTNECLWLARKWVLKIVINYRPIKVISYHAHIRVVKVSSRVWTTSRPVYQGTKVLRDSVHK